MNIYEKMSKITDELKTVAKNLKVQQTKQSSYKAVGERDVLDAVKPLEVKCGIYSYPAGREILESHILESENEYNGKITKKSTFMTRMKTVYRFVNIDEPNEFIETTVFSEGIDSQDKGSGKAMTYADKYALMKAYKISTGDDPDGEPSVPDDYKKPVICPNCNKPIKSVKIKGQVRSPEEILNQCGGMCLDCYKKTKDAEKTKKDNSDIEEVG